MPTIEDCHKMQVSVIIPAHNRTDLLHECLQSVAAQTHREIEVIVVDDASDEDIRRVVNSVQWPESFTIKTIRSDENVGPGTARELGRQAATGDFLCYLDSDDIWHPSKIAVQVQALLANPDAGMCYCMSTEFQALPITGREPLRKRCDVTLNEFLPDVFDGRPWGTAACMWTRYATDRIGKWLPTWNWEDFDYDCRAGLAGVRIHHVREVLTHYRVARNAGRVSIGNKAVARIEKAKSAIHIAEMITEFSSRSDASVRSAITLVLLRLAQGLMRDNQRMMGRMCLKAVCGVNNLASRSSFVARVGSIAARYLGSLNGARVTSRLSRLLRVVE